jgi:hypothetical protein
MTQTTKQFNSTYNIYKPNHKDASRGAVTSWEYNAQQGTFWLTMAKQSDRKSDGGRPTFDWKNKVSMRLDIIDLAAVHLVLTGRSPILGKPSDDNKGSGLFHKNAKGNSILKMYSHERWPDSIILEFSVKDQDNLFRGGQLLSAAEANALAIIIQECLMRIFDHSAEN